MNNRFIKGMGCNKIHGQALSKMRFNLLTMNVLDVTGRTEKVTPSHCAAETACKIQLRAVSSLLMPHSWAPAGGFTVANHSLSCCTNSGSVSGTARGGLYLISASASRFACCSSFVERPPRARAA